MMELKSDGLKKLVEKAMGFDMAPTDSRRLLSPTNPQDEENDTENMAVAKVDEELNFRAVRRLAAEVVNEQKNIEDVVRDADNILQKDPQAQTEGEEDVDQGWVSNFMEGAGKTYDTNLKEYWSRLLAGEIRSPGKYSLRTIDFMRKITKKDAERLREKCKLVMYSVNSNLQQDAFILRYKNSSFYDYSELSYLIELRLLNPNNTAVKRYVFEKQGKGKVLITHNNRALYFEVEQKKFELPVYSFTELGKEILSIIDDQEVDFNYLREFSNSLVANNNSIKITGGQIVEHDKRFGIAVDEFYFQLPKA